MKAHRVARVSTSWLAREPQAVASETRHPASACVICSFVRSLSRSFVRPSVRLYVRVYVLVARVRLSVSATTVISFLSFFLPLFLVPDRDHRTSVHTFFRSSVWECVTSCLSARAWYLILGHDTYPHEASIVCSASSSIAPPSFVPLARARPLVFLPLSLSFSPLAFLAFPSTKSRGKKKERERVEYVLCTSRGVHHPASIVCAAGARRLFSVISIVVLTRARGCVGVCVRVCCGGLRARNERTKMAADSGMETCPSPEIADSRKRPLDCDAENGATKRSHYGSGIPDWASSTPCVNDAGGAVARSQRFHSFARRRRHRSLVSSHAYSCTVRAIDYT